MIKVQEIIERKRDFLINNRYVAIFEYISSFEKFVQNRNIPIYFYIYLTKC